MTLQDAYDIHVAKMHIRTIRRFLGWRVVNAANQNCRGAFPLPVTTAKGEGRPVALPHLCETNSHTLTHNGTAQ